MCANTKPKTRRLGHVVAIDWQDHAWRPRVVALECADMFALRLARRVAALQDGQRTLRQPLPGRLPSHAQSTEDFDNQFSKPMKTMPLNFKIRNRHSGAISSILNRKSQIVNERAFTLVELLTVIAIIAILAAMLLPVLAAAKVEAQKKQARLQISDIVTAIQKYNSDYSRMPVSRDVQTLVGNSPATYNGCFTYGDTNFTPFTPSPISANYLTNNSEVISILMDITNYPDGSGATANANYQKNPQQNVYLNAKPVSDPSLPGVGPGLIYRDPWKNPYIITMDLNDDNQCKDAFYSLAKVSGYNQGNQNPGLNGLTSPDTSIPDNFRYHGNVMVWSAGPDKKIDPTQPANQGFNRDNILSWQ